MNNKIQHIYVYKLHTAVFDVIDKQKVYFNNQQLSCGVFIQLNYMVKSKIVI